MRTSDPAGRPATWVGVRSCPCCSAHYAASTSIASAAGSSAAPASISPPSGQRLSSALRVTRAAPRVVLGTVSNSWEQCWGAQCYTFTGKKWYIPLLINFSSGMGEWYMKVVSESFDSFQLPEFDFFLRCVTHATRVTGGPGSTVSSIIGHSTSPTSGPRSPGVDAASDRPVRTL